MKKEDLKTVMEEIDKIARSSVRKQTAEEIEQMKSGILDQYTFQVKRLE